MLILIASTVAKVITFSADFYNNYGRCYIQRSCLLQLRCVPGKHLIFDHTGLATKTLQKWCSDSTNVFDIRKCSYRTDQGLDRIKHS